MRGGEVTKVELRDQGERSDGFLKQRYDKKVPKRQKYLDRARVAARYTLPYIMPEEDSKDGDDFFAKYQSLGGEAVNHLSSKILLSILPPNESFFRLKLNEIEMKNLEVEDERAEVDAELALIERSSVDELKAAGIYSTGFEIGKHLIICGNILVYYPNKSEISLFHLDSYIVVRDPSDNVLEIITKEKADFDTLPEHVREQLMGTVSEDQRNDDEPVEIYTQIKRGKNQWIVKQEIEGQEIELEGKNTYPLNDCPWIPLRFWKVSGEAYGRAYVGDYVGDFRSYDKLSKAVEQSAGLAAKILYLLDPGSAITKRQLAESKTGDVLHGKKEDIALLQLEKYADLSFVKDVMMEKQKRISRAFLLFSSIQRDGERVTAYEIQKGIQELESVLGGFYTVLTKDLQEPLVRRTLSRLKAKQNIELPEQIVQTQITTGLQGLGRGQDLDKLYALADFVQKLFGEDGVKRFLHPGEFVQRAGNALSVNPVGLVKTKQEIKSDDQANHNRNLQVEQAGPLVQQQTELGKAQMSAQPQQNQGESIGR